MVRADELPVYSSAPVFRISFDVAGSGTLTAKVAAYQYVSALFTRRPEAIGKVSGTGLIAPVFASGLGARIKQGRALRAQLAEIESGVVTPEEQAEAYVAALQRERHGWLRSLDHALALGTKHEMLFGTGPNGGPLKSEQSGLELAEEAKAAISAIEAELARVGAN